jgi:uncharacterized SAM-binding protein YcdF (DUF218 family)
VLGLIFAPLRLAFKIVSALVTLLVLYLAVTFAQVWLTGRDHSTGTAQAIIVFGTTEDNGTPSPVLAARLKETLAVYQAHRAPWVVVTGGKRPGDVYSEAGVSATFLEQHGVPAGRIIIGSGSDTWQNISSVIATLKQRGLIHVITVTDPFHEYRAMAIASAQGLYPKPSPVPSSSTISSSLWHYYLKETVAVAAGRIVGYGTLSHWTTGHSITWPSGG